MRLFSLPFTVRITFNNAVAIAMALKNNHISILLRFPDNFDLSLLNRGIIPYNGPDHNDVTAFRLPGSCCLFMLTISRAL